MSECPRCGDPTCSNPDSRGCSDGLIAKYRQLLRDAAECLAEIIVSDDEYPQDHMADEVNDARICVSRIDAALRRQKR